MPVTAVVLAGERAEGDPLAAHFGVAAKALIPVHGQPMGDRVVRTLRASPAVEVVRVFGNTEMLRALDDVSVEPSDATIAATVRPLVTGLTGPLLITTADHPLLTPDTVDAFVRQAQGHDVAVAVVAQSVFTRHFPDNRRTWLRFRKGAYSGANLFWIGSSRVLPMLDIWARVEQQRKRGRALIGAFGPLLLAGVALRLLTIDQAIASAGRRHRVSAKAVVLDDPRACIDVDSVADRALVELIIADG